jgi:hypothetical protein
MAISGAEMLVIHSATLEDDSSQTVGRSVNARTTAKLPGFGIAPSLLTVSRLRPWRNSGWHSAFRDSGQMRHL